MKRHLPVLAEKVVSDVKALQVKTGQDFEAALKRDPKQRVSCKKGCDNCCKHPFLVTIAEGILVYRALVSSRRWAKVKPQLIEHRDTTLGLTFEVWLLGKIPCPLLKGHDCSVYESRPLRCRVMFSEGDPNLCDPHALGVGTPLVNSADTVIAFTQEARSKLKKLGVQGSLMPLSEAVLLAEQIETGIYTIEESDFRYAKDLYREP